MSDSSNGCIIAGLLYSATAAVFVGSGFLAWVAYAELKRAYRFDIDVVGRSNADLWGDVLVSEPNGTYDVVIDLGAGTEVFDKPILNNEALIIFGVEKTVTTNFANILWKACTMVFPSPRTDYFLTSMYHAVNMIKNGKHGISRRERCKNGGEEYNCSNAREFIPFAWCFSQNLKIRAGAHHHEFLKTIHFRICHMIWIDVLV